MTTLPAGGSGSGGDGPRWPKANPLRGFAYSDESMTNTYVDHARHFISEFDFGDYLSQETFDEWLQAEGLLLIPPKGTPKKSDPWVGHIYRRNRLRAHINLAATHPRMYELSSKCFLIDVWEDGYQVKEPHDRTITAAMLRRINSLTDHKVRTFEYLLQGTAWEQLEPWERVHIEGLYEDFLGFKQLVILQLTNLTTKYNKMYDRLSKAGKLPQIVQQTEPEDEPEILETETDPSEETTTPQDTSAYNKLCSIFGTVKGEEETHNDFKNRILHDISSMEDGSYEELPDDIKDWSCQASITHKQNQNRHTNYALPHLDGLDDNNPGGK